MNDAAACVYTYTFFLSGATAVLRPRPPRFEVSRSHAITHTITHTHTHTHSGTPLNAWSARRRGHYPHDKHKRRTCTVVAMRRLHTYTLAWPLESANVFLPVGGPIIDRALPVQHQTAFAIQFSSEVPIWRLHDQWMCSTLNHNTA